MIRFLLLVLAILPLPLSAQVARDSMLTVSASRTTKIAPDRATFYLIVEGTAETAMDAIARVETKLKSVADALKSVTPRLVLDAPIPYGVGPSVAQNGYSGVALPVTNLARSIIRVQLNRPEQLAHVVATAIGAGAASSSSLNFESSVADSVRRSRIGDAMNVARLDAEAIAASLGARLGTLVSVSSNGSQFGFVGPTTLNFDNRFGQQAATPDITVTSTVTVQYRLIR